MSLAEHEKNYNDMKKIYFATEMVVQYRKSMQAIQADTDITEIEKKVLSDRLNEYYRVKVDDSSKESEVFKALKMFYVKTVRYLPIDEEFISDLSLHRVHIAREFCINYLNALSKRNVVDYTYKYWLNRLIDVEVEKGEGESVIENASRGLIELKDLDYIDDSMYLKLCNSLRASLEKLRDTLLALSVTEKQKEKEG
jgi:hypothetical protein